MGNDAEIIDVEVIPIPENYSLNSGGKGFIPVNATDAIKLPDAKGSKLTKETINTVLQLYNNISEEYGFTVNWDITSIQKNFENIISDDKEEIFKILISKAFSKFQLVFYQQAMTNIMTLMQQVSAPEVINDMSISVEYKYGMLNQLLSLMNQVSDMYEKVKVENSDLILKRIAENQTEGGGLESLQMDPKTIEVMKQLKKLSLNPHKEDN